MTELVEVTDLLTELAESQYQPATHKVTELVEVTDSLSELLKVIFRKFSISTLSRWLSVVEATAD